MTDAQKYTNETAALYASLGVMGTTYQVPFDALTVEFGSLQNQKVLDFGCGAGRSTRLLQTLSPQYLIGVDHNLAMIDQARTSHKDIVFLSVPENGRPLPFIDESFDTIFAFYVYCEFSDYDIMRQTTSEIYRVLKPNGSFFVITTNPACLGSNFISFHYNQKMDVKDGDPIVCHVHTDPPFTIADTWWSLTAFDNIFHSCGFQIAKRLFPLAKGDGWCDETRMAPEVIYRLIKSAGLEPL